MVLFCGKNIFKTNTKSGKIPIKIDVKSGKNIDYFSELC